VPGATGGAAVAAGLAAAGFFAGAWANSIARKGGTGGAKPPENMKASNRP
jgi:hypothetical protein